MVPHSRKGGAPVPSESWLLAISWVHFASPSSHPKNKKRLKQKLAWHLKTLLCCPHYMTSERQQPSLVYTSLVPIPIRLCAPTLGNNSASTFWIWLLFCWDSRKTLFCHNAGHTKVRKKSRFCGAMGSRFLDCKMRQIKCCGFESHQSHENSHHHKNTCKRNLSDILKLLPFQWFCHGLMVRKLD